MIGRMLLAFKNRFGHGFRTAWLRDVVRPKILKTSPILANDDTCCEIHVYTSANDWLNLMWALKSFYWASERHYALAIHDDGSLDTNARKQIKTHFPKARLIDRESADQTVLPSLADYPRCKEFRETNQLSPKVFDFRQYLNSDRMLLLDSDVLFFSPPQELLQRIENPQYLKNTVNGDVSSAYTVEPNIVKEKFGFELIDRFNSGLGLIHKESLRLDWLEEFLEIPGIIGHHWRIEQTLFALSSCRFGAELLPQDYDVFLDGELGSKQSRHYVGSIRHLMYSEGIKKLSNSLGQWSQ